MAYTGGDLDPSQLLDENGNPIGQQPKIPTPGLPAGAQTGADTQGGEAPPDPTVPDTTTTTPPPDTTGGTQRTPRHGGITDPATGQQTVGQPTGAPPGSRTNTLDDLLAQLIKDQQARDADAATQRTNLRGQLNTLITDASRPVSATDPQIAAPTNAFFAQGQRSRALLQEKLAQEAASGGLPTGEVERGVNQSFSDLGNATGGYSANLMTNELAQRRDELKSALSLGAGLLTSEEAQSLQQQLAAIEAQMNNQHFYDTLSTGLGEKANSLDDLLAQWLKGSSAAA